MRMSRKDNEIGFLIAYKRPFFNYCAEGFSVLSAGSTRPGNMRRVRKLVVETLRTSRELRSSKVELFSLELLEFRTFRTP